MSESNSMRERGRQIKGGSLELIPRKGPTRATAAFLDTTKQEIVHRWLHRGQTTREISRGLRIHDREAVERAVHDVLAPKTGPSIVIRRAA